MTDEQGAELGTKMRSLDITAYYALFIPNITQHAHLCRGPGGLE